MERLIQSMAGCSRKESTITRKESKRVSKAWLICSQDPKIGKRFSDSGLDFYKEHGKFIDKITLKYIGNDKSYNNMLMLTQNEMLQLKTRKDLMRVVRTLAKLVAFFIKTFMAGSFMSLPVALPAATTVCKNVSATSLTLPIKD